MTDADSYAAALRVPPRGAFVQTFGAFLKAPRTIGGVTPSKDLDELLASDERAIPRGPPVAVVHRRSDAGRRARLGPSERGTDPGSRARAHEDAPRPRASHSRARRRALPRVAGSRGVRRSRRPRHGAEGLARRVHRSAGARAIERRPRGRGQRGLLRREPAALRGAHVHRSERRPRLDGEGRRPGARRRARDALRRRERHAHAPAQAPRAARRAARRRLAGGGGARPRRDGAQPAAAAQVLGHLVPDRAEPGAGPGGQGAPARGEPLARRRSRARLAARRSRTSARSFGESRARRRPTGASVTESVEQPRGLYLSPAPQMLHAGAQLRAA